MKGKAVGTSLFYEGWANWGKYLKFRNVGQGKRCKVCAALDEERSQASSQAEKAEVCSRKREHLVGVMQDRAADERSSLLAEDDATKRR